MRTNWTLIAAMAVVSTLALGCSSDSDDRADSSTTTASDRSGGEETGGGGRDEITGVLGGLTMDGQPVPCSARTDGVRVCQDDDGLEGDDLRLESFDGTPLALYVTLPPLPASGGDGGFPLVVQSHGWGAPPSGPDDAQYGGPTALQWAADGYAVLQLTARGWGDSCGSAESRAVDEEACSAGYTHLDDVRFEARDVQNAVGLLVQESIVDPDRIGVTGESLGGGISLALATLNSRVMTEEGSLEPWTSPDGTPLHIAAAAPFAPWSDLVHSLMPNGRTLDSEVTSTTADLSPIGVMKQSIVAGLYLVGESMGYYAPPGSDPDADVPRWYANIDAGEPYDAPEDAALVEQIARFRSPYYLLAGNDESDPAPAPLLISSGFTDEVFPADEALRYYNLERSMYPDNPISLFLADIGHQRANSKPADLELLLPRIQAFFDHYLEGTGPQPASDVTALTTTCPATEPSGGPFSAPSWGELHPGEVLYSSAPAQVIRSDGGDPAIASTFDPVLGGPVCTTAPAADEGAGTATYILPTPTGSGYTLLGSPTVTADVEVTGEHAYIAARLLDVDTATNTQTLVTRGLFRIEPGSDGGVVFQLHPAAWHFEEGHVPTLQLLGRDSPYARPANGEFSMTVRDLELRLPVHEVPGEPDTPTEVTEPTPTD